MNANNWQVERATATDIRDQAVSGSDFPWYAVWTHPTMGLVRIPFASEHAARDYAAARNANALSA